MKHNSACVQHGRPTQGKHENKDTDGRVPDALALVDGRGGGALLALVPSERHARVVHVGELGGALPATRVQRRQIPPIFVHQVACTSTFAVFCNATKYVFGTLFMRAN